MTAKINEFSVFGEMLRASISIIATLAPFDGKRNASDWRSSVRSSACPSVCLTSYEVMQSGLNKNMQIN